MTRTFTCIVCPNGCEITAQYEGAEVSSVTGATCPKGKDYVLQELTDPRRTIATSVPVDGGELPLVSVRLNRPIPKEDIFRAPTAIGQVAIPNVCDLDADVIITQSVAAL